MKINIKCEIIWFYRVGAGEDCACIEGGGVECWRHTVTTAAHGVWSWTSVAPQTARGEADCMYSLPSEKITFVPLFSVSLNIP